MGTKYINKSQFSTFDDVHVALDRRVLRLDGVDGAPELEELLLQVAASPRRPTAAAVIGPEALLTPHSVRSRRVPGERPPFLRLVPKNTIFSLLFTGITNTVY